MRGSHGAATPHHSTASCRGRRAHGKDPIATPFSKGRNSCRMLNLPRGIVTRGGKWMAAVLVLLVIGVLVGWRRVTASTGVAQTGKPPPTAVPVSVAQVKTEDFPVY